MTRDSDRELAGFFAWCPDSKGNRITGGDLVKLVGGNILYEVRSIEIQSELVVVRQVSHLKVAGHPDINKGRALPAIVRRSVSAKQLVKQEKL